MSSRSRSNRVHRRIDHITAENARPQRVLRVRCPGALAVPRGRATVTAAAYPRSRATG